MIISIDLWGTLIKSSPLFVKAKVELTQKYFDVDEQQILKCYSDTKKELNSIIEVTGWQPSPSVIFNLLFSKLNDGEYYPPSNIYDDFVSKYQELAIEIMPEIYSDETKYYLGKLSELGHLYLSSNTMFIQGDTLEEIINKLGIGGVFTHCFFSDEMGRSKPSKQMYGGSNFHIGDNNLTDRIGALNAGSTAIIINSNSSTIKDAYNFIAQNG